MLYEILFVAGLFITRIALPVLCTLVLGDWLRRRLEGNRPAHS